MASGPITSLQIGGKWKQWQILFSWAPKITADGDYSHEIKRHLTPWKESYDKPRQRIKKQRYHFASEGPYSQTYGFSCSHVCIKKAECWRTDAFKLWCLRRLESSLGGKEIKPVNPQGNKPEYSLKGLVPKLRLEYFGHLMRRADSLEKTLMAKIDGKRRRGQQKVRWLHSITDSTRIWANPRR